jgi:hypothetical protein
LFTIFQRGILIRTIGAGTLIAPFAALAQQPPKTAEKIWRVGVLAPSNRAAALDPLFSGAFPLGMRELG